MRESLDSSYKTSIFTIVVVHLNRLVGGPEKFIFSILKEVLSWLQILQPLQ